MLKNIYHRSQSGVWRRAKNQSFEYSDGDEVEERLLDQVKKAKDVSLASDELQRLMVDWPSEYHFSPLRANLLSPFHFGKFKNILEIGSGCGAITRFLGEKCTESNILALEGSMNRAEITRARCRNLKNVKVYQDSFNEFVHDTSFDLIMMIGMLEYSPVYFDCDEPIVAALKRARNLLSTNGLLVVAIENQLGLKYFGGCGEDHNGIPFSGINDLYLPGSPRTFGKKHIEQQLNLAGFENIEFIYPFPDYKLPQLLMREESFLCEKIDISCLAGQYPSRDYGRKVDRIFQEARVWKLLSKNGLIRDLSNSFLVFAFSSKTTLDDITDKWLVKLFSGRRKKRYLIETNFIKESGKVVVKKTLSYPHISENINGNKSNIIHHVGKTRYIQGVPYCDKLTNLLTGEGTFKALMQYFAPWVDWLKESSFKNSSPGQANTVQVSGSLYDCMPANILTDTKKNLYIIDQEWESKAPLDIGFLLFRGFYREFIANLEFFKETDLFVDGNILYILNKYYNTFNIPFDRSILKEYIDLEISFQMEVVQYSVGRTDLIHNVYQFLEKKRKRKSKLSDLIQSGGGCKYDSIMRRERALALTLVERDEQLVKITKLLIEHNALLDVIFNSNSWKITVPLRLARNILKEGLNNIEYVRKYVRKSISNSEIKLLEYFWKGLKK